MIGKTMISAAFAVAALGAVPSVAQMTGQSGSMGGQDRSMGGSTMGNGGMSTGMAKMSKSQMATMKRCQAMTSDKMMKNRSCIKLQKMHPEMMNSSSTM